MPSAQKPLPPALHAPTTVLVTQTALTAAPLMQALQNAGFQSHHCPAFKIVYQHATLPNDDTDIGADFIVVTSPNAVIGAQKANLNLPRKLPYFAVGKGSASALRQRGIEQVYTAQPASSEGLLAISELQQPSLHHGWLLTGVGGRGLLDKTLPTLGLSITRIETYRREACLNSATLTAALQPAPQIVIATSSETLDNFARISDAASSVLLGQCHWVVSSARIANQLLKHWPKATHTITTGPDAEALLSACKTWKQGH